MATQASGAKNEVTQARAFLNLLWQRFKDDRCFDSAAALSYATLFALVPLATVSIGIMSVFPQFAKFSERASDFLFEHFVPKAARTVQGYLSGFALNAQQITWLGAFALLLSAVVMLASAEDTLNRIFRADRHRPPLKRFLMYWTMLTFGPIMIGAGFAASTMLLELPGGAENVPWPHAVPRWLVALLPAFLAWVGVTLTFRVVPNTLVRLKHAAIGALLTCFLFLLAKRGFGAFLGSGQTYQQIYGALALVPVVLVWIYLSWVSLLFGALLAACLGAYRAPIMMDASGHELFTFIRLLASVRRTWSKRGQYPRVQWIAESAGLHPERAQQLLALALSERVLHEGDDAMLAPAPVPASVTLAGVVERAGFRLPDADELDSLEVIATGPERRFISRLREARHTMQSALDQPLESLLVALAGPPAPDPGKSKETP
jgi:membrane protein